jgi:NitT/TauT family transport system ATP-binding protein
VQQPFLRVDQLSAGFKRPEGWLPVLDRLSFQVGEGEFTCLVGPSGCGKTTLLRLLAGLDRPQEGRIELAGKEVDRPRRSVGMVFQEPRLMAWRTVEQNLALPLEIVGAPAEEILTQTSALADLVGLDGFERSYPSQLSGGMAQRAALARALIHDPEILLLDEPFGALDALTRERMAQELLRIWRARRKTVIMVTHSVPEAVFLADRVLVLGPRPTTIRVEISIDLPRPRGTTVLGSAEAGRLASRVREALADQA